MARKRVKKIREDLAMQNKFVSSGKPYEGPVDYNNAQVAVSALIFYVYVFARV